MGWLFRATGEVPRVTEGGMEVTVTPWGLPATGIGDILLNIG